MYRDKQDFSCVVKAFSVGLRAKLPDWEDGLELYVDKATNNVVLFGVDGDYAVEGSDIMRKDWIILG